MLPTNCCFGPSVATSSLIRRTRLIASRGLSIDFSHEKPSPCQLEHVQKRVTETVPLFFRQRLDYTFYRRDVFCDDQIFNLQRRGIEELMRHFGLIAVSGQFFLPHVQMEAISVLPILEEGTVRCRWRVKYISFYRLLTNPRLFRFDYRMRNLSWYDGMAIFDVDGNGQVYKLTLQKTNIDNSRFFLKSPAEKIREKVASLNPQPST